MENYKIQMEFHKKKWVEALNDSNEWSFREQYILTKEKDWNAILKPPPIHKNAINFYIRIKN